jgi:tetratricopeptide (TPR) repeat protein
VAETGLRQAIADWRQLGQRHPGVIEYQRRVWYSYHTLAELLARTGRIDDAQATIDDAMKLSTELHKVFGGRAAIIQTMLQRGKLYAEQDLFEKAEKDLIEVRDIYRSWTGEQSFNIFNFVGFGMACNELAHLYSKAERPNDEKAVLEEGLEKWNYLTKYDGYPDHDRGLAMCHLGLGQYFLRQGSLEESKEHLDLAYRAFTELDNADDTIVKNKDLLADALSELGRVHFEQQRQDQAIKKFEDELVLRERLVELCPQDVNYRRKLVACQRQLALLSSPRQ